MNGAEYEERDPKLSDLLLRQSDGGVGHNNGMCLEDMDTKSIALVGSSDYYRLFFLLEGDVLLRGRGFGKHPLHGGEFLLLPPSSGITCTALTPMRYAAVSCVGLRNGDTLSFREKLEARARELEYTFPTFPIHEKLGELLNRLGPLGSAGKDHSKALYDAVFIQLRRSYGQDELAQLFHPILLRGEQSENEPV
jgi:hypothetical protein